MRCGPPAGTVIAVIAEANFILHKLAEILHCHRAINGLAIRRGLFVFHQNRGWFSAPPAGAGALATCVEARCVLVPDCVLAIQI